MFERHEEVPVVAMYRKELAGPLLAMAADDVPLVSTEEDLQRQQDIRSKKHYDQGFVQPHHRRIRRCGDIGSGMQLLAWTSMDSMPGAFPDWSAVA